MTSFRIFLLDRLHCSLFAFFDTFDEFLGILFAFLFMRYKSSLTLRQSVIKCLGLIKKAGLTTDAARPLVSVLKAQNGNKAVQLALMPILTSMNSDKASTMLGELGAIQEIIFTLRKFDKGNYTGGSVYKL